MPSSSHMSGEAFTITEVRYDWSDNGHSYWTVYFTKADNSKWAVRVEGVDELGAYVQATRQLEGAD